MAGLQFTGSWWDRRRKRLNRVGGGGGGGGGIALSSPRTDQTGGLIMFDVASGTWAPGIVVDPSMVSLSATAATVDASGAATTASVAIPVGLRAEFVGGALCLWVEGGVYSDYSAVTISMQAGAITSGADTSAAMTSTAVTNNNVIFITPTPAGHIVGIPEGRTTLNVPFGVVRGPWRAEVAAMHWSGIAGVEWTITKPGQSAVTTWQGEERRSWYQDSAVVSDTQWTANAGGTAEGGLGVWPSPAGDGSTDPTGAVTITATIVPKVGGRSRARTITRTVYSAQAGTYPERNVWLDTVAGSDANDGLSAGAPKLTMAAACNTAGSVTGGATQTTVPIVNIVGGTSGSPRTVEISVPTTGSGNAIPSATDTYLRLQPAPGFARDTILIVNHAGAVSGYNSRVRRLAFHNLTIDMSDSPSGSSSKTLLSATASVYPVASNPQHYWFHRCRHTHRQGKLGQFSEGGSGNFLGTAHTKENLAYWTEWEHSDSGQRGIQSTTRNIMRNIRIFNIQKDVFKQPDCVFGFYTEDNAVAPVLLPVGAVTGSITAGDTVTGVYSWPSSATVQAVPAAGMVRLTPGGDSYQFKSDDSLTHTAITITGEVGTIVVGEEIRNSGNTVRFRVFRRDGNILRGRYTLGGTFPVSTALTGLTSGATATVGSIALNQTNLFFSPSGARATAQPPHPDGLQIQTFAPTRAVLSNIVGTFQVGEAVTCPGVANNPTISAIAGNVFDFGGTPLWETRTSNVITGVTSGATATVDLVYGIVTPTAPELNLILANGWMRRMDGQLLFGENGSQIAGIWNVTALKLDVESALVSQMANVAGLTVAHCTLPTSTWRLPLTARLAALGGTPPPGMTVIHNIFQQASSDYVPTGLSASTPNKGRPGVRSRNHLTRPVPSGSSRTVDVYTSEGDPAFVNGLAWNESDTLATLTKNNFKPSASVPGTTAVTAAVRLARYDMLGVERLASDWPGAVSSR
jgi:hypothetical protein